MRFALIAEGPADTPLVAVLARLCGSLGIADVEGEHVRGLEVGRTISARATALFEEDPDYDLLFVHMDGDKEGLELRRQRIDTALVDCRVPCPYVRVVPVRMTESWLLVDVQKIREVAGFHDGTADLDLPPSPSRIEAIRDPKSRLRKALVLAKRPPKRRKIRLSQMTDHEYAVARNELLESLDINGPVTRLRAWQALVDDTKAALVSLALSHP